MNKLMSTAALLALTASGAVAGGIDRSNHAIGALFEDGNYMELSFGSISPSVSSQGLAGAPAPFSLPTSDSTSSYTQLGLAVKMQLNEQFSMALIYEQPIGAQIQYTDGPFQNGRADIHSNGFMLLGRYEMNNGFSVHGGVRTQSASGTIATRVAGNPALLSASSDVGFGGVLGVAYERPDIALRVALTYFDGITNSFEGTENGSPGTLFEVDFPKSVNLDFQTGVAEDTLLFGSIRWADWDGVNLTTDVGEYVRFDQSTITYNLGLGRRLNENWSVAATIGYESGDGTGSTLGPTSGQRSIGLGGTWTEGNTKVSMGVRYIELGDATASAANIPFTDNSAWAAGVKVGWSF